MFRISAAIEPAGGRSESDQLYLLTRAEAEEKSLAVKLGREDFKGEEVDATPEVGLEPVPVGDWETGVRLLAVVAASPGSVSSSFSGVKAIIPLQN